MAALDEDWDIKVYEPPEAGWPFVVVSRHKDIKKPSAECYDTREAADKRKRQLHELRWRGKNVL